MLFFWNREELWSGHDMGKAMAIRSALKAEGIECSAKYRGSADFNPFASVGVIRTTPIVSVITIYVHKEDYKKACYLLRKILT